MTQIKFYHSGIGTEPGVLTKLDQILATGLSLLSKNHTFLFCCLGLRIRDLSHDHHNHVIVVEYLYAYSLVQDSERRSWKHIPISVVITVTVTKSS